MSRESGSECSASVEKLSISEKNIVRQRLSTPSSNGIPDFTSPFTTSTGAKEENDCSELRSQRCGGLQPLEKVTRELEAIEDLSFKQRDYPSSRIKEIAQLCAAIDAIRAFLKSMPLVFDLDQSNRPSRMFSKETELKKEPKHE